jgi:hypothetical protein
MDDTDRAITYLPTKGDWVSGNVAGWYNNTLQCVRRSAFMIHESSVLRADVFL